MTAYRTIRAALETSNLSEEARDLILTITDGDEHAGRDIADYYEHLEDVDALEEMGFDDPDAIEEACTFLKDLNREEDGAQTLYVFYSRGSGYELQIMTARNFLDRHKIEGLYSDWCLKGGYLEDATEFCDKENALEFLAECLYDGSIDAEEGDEMRAEIEVA